jgi:type VI secretion system protein VasG
MRVSKLPFACRTATSPAANCPTKPSACWILPALNSPLGQNSTPAAIEDLNRRIDDLEVQQRVLTREQAVGTDHAKRLAAIAEELAKSKTDVEALKRASRRSPAL